LRCILTQELDIDLTCSERFSLNCEETVICHRHYDNDTNAPINNLKDAEKVCSLYNGYNKKWSLKNLPEPTKLCNTGNSLLPLYKDVNFENGFFY
jgi:hypothetical protein